MDSAHVVNNSSKEDLHIFIVVYKYAVKMSSTCTRLSCVWYAYAFTHEYIHILVP